MNLKDEQTLPYLRTAMFGARFFSLCPHFQFSFLRYFPIIYHLQLCYRTIEMTNLSKQEKTLLQALLLAHDWDGRQLRNQAP